MFDIIIVFACLYFAYSNVKSLMTVPFSTWELQHWLLVLVTILLVAAGAYKGWVSYKKKKRQDEETAAKKEQEEAEKPVIEVHESDELAYLDEMDAQEDLAAASAQQIQPDKEETAKDKE